MNPSSFSSRGTRRPAFLFAIPLVAALSTTGCGGGALSQAVVSDVCHAGDGTCSKHGFDAPLALGASMRPEVDLTLRGTAGGAFHLDSAAPTILGVDGGKITGQGEGSSAVLFVSDSGEVLDFLHVYVKRASGLELLGSEQGEAAREVDGPIDLVRGESFRIRPIPEADGQRLVGQADAEWTSDSDSVTVLRDGEGATRRVFAVKPGTAKVHVKMLDVTASIDVVVSRTQGGAS